MNDQSFILLVLRFKTVIECKDNNECDVVWNNKKSSLINKSKINTWSKL